MATKLLVSSAATALLIGSAAAPVHAQAQQQPAQQQAQQRQEQGQQQQVAQQCLENLRAQARQIDEEGFWLTGWGQRWGGRTTMTPSTPVGGAPQPGTEAPRTGETGVTGRAPWTVTGMSPFGVRSPRYQISTLFAAANVLAYRGDEEACQAVLGELQSAYDQYTTQLREAGVDPAEITTWRQERIAAAEPVTELQQRGIVTVDNVIGADVRNLQDERLGSVDDIVLDPETGAVSYVVVARGGFFGVGEDHVAVPWQRFSATPDFNTLVLNVPEDALEQAPEIDPERFADLEAFGQVRQRTDEYWQEQQGG